MAGWEVAEGLETVVRGVPESLRNMVEQQLEQLSSTDQALLEAASVAGAEFSATAVAVGVDDMEEAVEARCDSLARRGQFLRALGVTAGQTAPSRPSMRHACTISGDLIRAGASEPPDAMASADRGAVGYRLWPGAREPAEELAEHFVRGCDPWRAVQYLQYAGENALRRSAHQEVIAHLRQGLLALLSTLPETPERTQKELTFQITLQAVLESLKGPTIPDTACTAPL